MQLSKNTIEVLKNLASINQKILIQPGKVLSAVSSQSNLVAIINVDDSFPEEMPLYDANQFLSVITSMEDPTLEIDPKDKNAVVIKSGKKRSKIFFAEKEMVKAAPSTVKMPATAVTFTLTNDDLQSLLKMASVLSLPDLVVNASNGVIKLEVNDSKNNTSSSFDVVVDDNYTGKDYKFYIKTELLKFIPGNYTVNIAAEKISQFVSDDGKRTYYVALESKA